MNTILIEKKLQQVTLAHGGHEKRFYLGMSSIARPEAELLDILINGSPEPSFADIQRLALGYEAEANIRARLERAGLIKPNSVRELSPSLIPGLKVIPMANGWTAACSKSNRRSIKSSIRSNRPANYRGIITRRCRCICITANTPEAFRSTLPVIRDEY